MISGSTLYRTSVIQQQTTIWCGICWLTDTGIKKWQEWPSSQFCQPSVAGTLAKIVSVVDRPYHHVSMACKLCTMHVTRSMYTLWQAAMKIVNNLMQNDRVKPIQNCRLLDPSTQKDKLKKVFIWFYWITWIDCRQNIVLSYHFHL